MLTRLPQDGDNILYQHSDRMQARYKPGDVMNKTMKRWFLKSLPSEKRWLCPEHLRYPRRCLYMYMERSGNNFTYYEHLLGCYHPNKNNIKPGRWDNSLNFSINVKGSLVIVRIVYKVSLWKALTYFLWNLI